MTDTRSALQIRKDVIAREKTTGPWASMPMRRGRHLGARVYSGDKIIAEIYDGAHGNLIAAAPETAAERDRLRAVNAELVAALRNMTALANNMRETIEGGNFATRYEIPYGYFNAAYVAMGQAESFQKHGEPT